MNKLFIGTVSFSILFMAVAYVYDLGIRQGQMSALKTAYDVCRKVAPRD